MAETIPKESIEQTEEENEEISEGEVTEGLNRASEANRISALDPDFLLILGFAGINDLVDFVLEWFDFTIVVKIILIVIDVIMFVVISGWIYSRTKRIVRSKKTF